jgi:hypothetical protein
MPKTRLLAPSLSLALVALTFGQPSNASGGPPILANPVIDDEISSVHAEMARDGIGWGLTRRLVGPATWYRWRIGQAAAGPRLRAALGPHWRGRIVRVVANGRSIVVRLTDWCACPYGRIIDLDMRSFRALTPLWRGVLRVTVFH